MAADSLRMRVVEAMADAWKEARQSPIVNIAAAEAVLDAMLDALAENRSDWADWNAAECADDAEGCNCVSDEQVLGLLQVLREE